MKNFITLDYVPCIRDNELTRGLHTLAKGLDYETTNAQYTEEGHFYFELWDDDGYIGSYLIRKKHLHLIKEINFVESE